MKSKNSNRRGFSYPNELEGVIQDLTSRQALSKTICNLLADKYGVRLGEKYKWYW